MAAASITPLSEPAIQIVTVVIRINVGKKTSLSLFAGLIPFIYIGA